MIRLWTALALAGATLAIWAAPALAWSKQDVTIPMDDGVALAGTLYLPDGTAPAGGRPAIVFLHGLGGTRQQMNALVESLGYAGSDYVVLSFDARGHGSSGGVVSIDGPREIADVRAVHAWLAARPDVADRKIGAWGISYGGGAIFNSLVAGVPWAAATTIETWTDLTRALTPQGLVKSGVVAGLSSSIPPERRARELDSIQASAFAGTNAGAVRAWTAARSSIAGLARVTTPVFMMQGRRDFLFGIDQGSRALAALKGPKRLWIGNHGHAPSTFPAVDSPLMFAEARAWFDRFLRGVRNGVETRARVVLVDEGKTTKRSFGSMPRTTRTVTPLRASRTIAQSGKVVVESRPLARRTEVFGSPTVRVTADARGGWSRIVAVLSARTPAGKEIVVSAGGVPARAGKKAYAISLIDQATVVPKGSRLVVTIGSASTAQDPGNLVYLDLPMPAGAKLAVSGVELRLPTLPDVGR